MPAAWSRYQAFTFLLKVGRTGCLALCRISFHFTTVHCCRWWPLIQVTLSRNSFTLLHVRVPAGHAKAVQHILNGKAFTCVCVCVCVCVYVWSGVYVESTMHREEVTRSTHPFPQHATVGLSPQRKLPLEWKGCSRNKTFPFLPTHTQNSLK